MNYNSGILSFFSKHTKAFILVSLSALAVNLIALRNFDFQVAITALSVQMVGSGAALTCLAHDAKALLGQADKERDCL